MPQLTSPRLPGVPILLPDATGPTYSRWRRSIRFALETKGTWKYCNGKCLMPMPKAGANSKSSKNSTANIQPSLLEERRAWVRHDREVKLDIFLSLADEVMQEVFEVGPPLPPSNLNAREMLKALDAQFVEFKFEPYHHAFCHFLNLHIDQYASIDEFNKEFSATLEDLLDHGQPLSNTQACSAYFSKLRCTQNPWVAKKIEEWDAQSSEPELIDFMSESPPWSFVRPLVTKCSQSFQIVSVPEESSEDSSVQSESDAASEPSNASVVSSRTSHSRHTSSITTHSQEITVHTVSEDVVEIDPLAFRKELEKLPASAIPERFSSQDRVPHKSLLEATTGPDAVPQWLNSKNVAPMSLPAPIHRPLPPLPPQATQPTETETRSRSTSPQALPAILKSSSQIILTIPTLNTSPPTSIPATQSPMLKLETMHPPLRPQTPTPTPLPTEHPVFRVNAPIPQTSTKLTPSDIHPALRPRSPTPTPAQAQPPITKPRTSSPPLKLPDFVSSSPNLVIPWPSTPDVPQRPHSSRAALPFHQQHHEPVQHQKEEQPHQHDDVSPDVSPVRALEPNRVESTNSSVISLPLQGTRDSAWDYLYEQKSSIHHPLRDHFVSPVSSESSESREPSAAAAGRDITALPQLKGMMSRAPTFDHFVVPSLALPPPGKSQAPSHSNKASSSCSGRDFMARLSGDSLLESSEEVREREQAKRHRKKMSWSVNVNLARFSASKGVKEIV